jgi:Mg2+ and Co2+ transporter CorA
MDAQSNYPTFVGTLKSGEKVFEDSLGYGIEKGWAFLVEPTTEELNEIDEIQKNLSPKLGVTNRKENEGGKL